ncbi:MAG: glycosyltransferase family 2 protein [Victivallaceae bacterium]|nr:glycosyltransferase family 2 protein [Victivallaceae bacterium]
MSKEKLKKCHDLTLCLCVFNVEKYVIETLESLRRQTFKDFRLLILDDCSTDSTKEIIQSYFDENPWVVPEIVEFRENHGTAYLRDYALHHCVTPLLMFFDADDIAKPTMVERLHEKIKSDPDLIAVSCYCNYMDACGNKLDGGIYLGPKNREEFLDRAKNGKMMFITPPTLFRREYALQAGGYRQAEWFPLRNDGIRYEDMSEDVDLWGRMSDFYKDGKYIVTISEVLFLYRKNTNTLSTGFAKARVMGQKLLYIKANIKRRRSGLSELEFADYWASLGWWARWNFERRNLGAYFYRQACFAWVKHRLVVCALDLLVGCLASPLYPLEKYRANFRKANR